MVFVFALLASTNTWAQSDKANRDSMRQAKMEELKKLRKDLLIKKLELTDAEAEKFFPIYDEYQLKLRQSQKEFHKKWKGKKPEDLTEEEAIQFLDDATAAREKEVALFKEYSEKLKAAIPAKKIVILPRVEREVRKELIDKARDGKKGPHPPKRGKGGPHPPPPPPMEDDGP